MAAAISRSGSAIRTSSSSTCRLMPNSRSTTSTTASPVPMDPTPSSKPADTRAYGAFSENFPSYPLTFEFRHRYADWRHRRLPEQPQHLLLRRCRSDFGHAGECRPRRLATAERPPPAQTLLPSSAVQGRLLSTTTALYEPRADATTNFVIPGGRAWWVIDAQGGFYELWISCVAHPIWVPAEHDGTELRLAVERRTAAGCGRINHDLDSRRFRAA